IVGSPDVAGPWSTKLYNLLRAIQYGDAPDKFGWITFAG
ncbi:MAG: branched chain amino acid aminotransferase, partial [Odoribacteraceae bacterium]|nr:branched chain amino acid aminotransferase [Odoribacteraceae bacterium]